MFFLALAKLFNFMVKLFFAHQIQFGNIYSNFNYAAIQKFLTYTVKNYL